MDPVKHSLVEDIYATVLSSSCVAFGLILLKSGGLAAGGTAGAALILSYITNIKVTTLFVLINLPFFWFAWRSGGTVFCIKTVIVNLSILGMGYVLPFGFHMDWVNPIFAAIFGGSLVGLGGLAVVRHGGSLGGSGVVAVLLERSRGWNAGRTQMIFDVVVLSCSLLMVDMTRLAVSVVSAIAVNLILMVNHKPGRYLGS